MASSSSSSPPPQLSPNSSSRDDRLRHDQATEILKATDTLSLATFLNKLHFSENSSELQDAQELFHHLKQNEVTPFVDCLFSFIKKCNSQNLADKLNAIEALSLLLLTDEGYELCHETSFLDKGLKSAILDCLHDNTESFKRISPVIQEFLVKLVIKEVRRENEWPELTEFLYESLCDKSEEKVKFALHLLSNLIPKCTVHGCFKDRLLEILLSRQMSLETIVQAAQTSCHFILHCTNRSNCDDGYTELVDQILEIFYNSVRGNSSEKHAQVLLKELIGLAWSLSTHFDKVVKHMFMILDRSKLQEKTKYLALELLVIVTEEKYECQRGLSPESSDWHFVKKLVKRVLCMLKVIKDKPEWEAAGEFDDKSQVELTRAHWKKSLGRIAAALGGEVLMTIYTKSFHTQLNDVEWKTRHASVTFLGIVAESCSKLQMTNHRQNRVAELLKTSIKEDKHPRVCWAALGAIGKFCKKFGPEFQEFSHQHVFGALVTAIDDSTHPQVQEKAISTMLLFVDNCTSYVLKSYLKELVRKLMDQIEKGDHMVKVGALKVLASVANSSKDQFEQWYSTVIRYLKVVIMTAKANFNHILLATSIECVTILWMAVGREKITDIDIEQVVEVLTFLQRPKLEDNNRIRCQVLQAWGRLCRCLGQDFKPYAMVAIPCLLKAAKIKSFVFVPENPENLKESDGSIRALTVEGQTTWIHTNVLELKVIACIELCSCASVLKDEFYVWIKEVAQTLIPLLNFEYNEEIRRVAALAMPVLLESSKAAVKKQYIARSSKTPFTELCYDILSALVQALTKGIGVEILNSLEECMKVAGAILKQDEINFFLDQIMKVLINIPNISRRKMVNVESTKQELVQEGNLKEDKVFDKAADCLSTLIGTQKYDLPSFIDKLLQFIQLMWENDKTAKERRVALRIFSEFVQRFKETAFEGSRKSLKDLFSTCKDRIPEVQEVVAQAIGISAEFCGSEFKSLIEVAVTGLLAVIDHPKALEKEYVMGHDAAVSALGKVLKFQESENLYARALKIWLKHLPIKSNRDEAKVVHQHLCLLFEESKLKLLGRNNDYLPEIVRVYAEILLADRNLATEHTSKKMTRQLKEQKEKSRCGHWKSYISFLEPHQQKKLDMIMSNI